MNKYFLVGIPGCGKSTLGQRVAAILEIQFFDTDIVAHNRIGEVRPIDLFSSYFHSRFRMEQIRVVAELSGLDAPAIIATGAEVALMPECIGYMQSTGNIIHIKRNPEIVLAGIKSDGGRRLILRNETIGTEVVMQEESVRLYAEELSQYEIVSNLTMENNGNEDEGVETLIALINKNQQSNHKGA